MLLALENVDIGAGYSTSILNAIRMALTTSRVISMQSEDTTYKPISNSEAFWMATLGGATGYPHV